MAAKIYRINYKSDFILTLVSDAGWMTPFCIKFWTGAPSQAFFVGWDGETYTHCAFDPSEPTKLLVQFDDHHLPIGDLKFQIAYHFTVADFPNDTEDEVINPANITTEIDGEEYQVMLDFNGETAPEIEFSLPAYANEAQRIANEQQRITAETMRIDDEETRIANEQTRINQEQTRQQNEQQRINQEQARVNEYASLKADAVAATVAANDAAALANQKAQLAADKAALAQSAANLANAKAQLAADKAALAASAAQLANDKAALAQQKAEYAQTQGGYAKDQGDYAKAQGDTALADHQRAESDHGIAADDHTQAGNDHTRAESDHGIAADDHTQAGNDHTRAESDHGIAADDHTQAGNDHTRADSDHDIAADDHTQAGNDHTRAESDHTRAESDHAAVEVYVDSLGAFDISAYHATGGVLAEYADLTAAIGTNGANIPDALRKGGMSVKFVQSSDHKYVQFQCKTQSFSTNPADWVDITDAVENVSEISKEKVLSEGKTIQITDDAGTEVIHEITEDYANFKNLKNNGKDVLDTDNLEDITDDINSVEKNLTPASSWVKLPFYLITNNQYSTGGQSIVIPCKGGDSYFVKGGGGNCIIAFVKTYPEVGDNADYATGSQRTVVTGTNEIEGTVPEDATYLYVSYSIGDTSWFAENIVINGYDYALGLFGTVKESIDEINETIPELQADIEEYERKTESISHSKIIEGEEIIELSDDNEKTITTIEGTRLQDINDEILFVDSDYDEEIPDDSKVALSIKKERTKAKTFVANDFKTEDGVTIVKEKYFKQAQFIPDLTSPNLGGTVFYNGDTKVNSNYIVNAVAYPNGEIIACRRGGAVVKIAKDGTETTLMTISGAGDWRGVFMDKDLNVYVSPHASFGGSGMAMTDRGLYRLTYGQSTFEKVISLYDPNSDVPSEAVQNDDTIWTMCQDRKGYLYAGVYSHTTRFNPAIYRSTDNGVTWTYLYNFITSEVCASGHHIHTIIYNEFDNKLYCIVGEVNEIYCSSDNGVTWNALGVQLEDGKGSAMIAVKDGLIVGSDTAYSCLMSKVYTNKDHKTTGRMWANTVFAIRRSDLTGWLYAFTKIDSSVNVVSYMPPIEAINDAEVLQDWIDGNPAGLAGWQKMYNATKDYYPDDCIRPQHCAILCSKDDGETWEIVYKKYTTSDKAYGFPTTGHFRNGECLAGSTVNVDGYLNFTNPVVISEGKHKYISDGLDVSDSIFSKTLLNTIINN